jgi:hypothetical protein
MRQMVERYYLGGVDAIEGWGCSHCRWTHILDDPIGRDDVPSDLRYRAQEVFNQHACAEHPA